MNSTGIFQLHPLVPVALCLILGIMTGRWLQPHVGCVAWTVAVAVSLVACLPLRRHPVLQTHCLLLCTFLTGCALISIAERSYKSPLPHGAARYEAVVASEPVERGKTLRFDMIVASGPLRGRTVRASLLKDTVAGRYKSLGVGDGLVASSDIKPPANFAGSSFDYVTYLKAHGIAAQTFIFHSHWHKAAVSLRGLSVWQRSRLSFMRLRHRLIGQYRALGLSGQSFAVAAAMTLGHRSEISSSLRDAYSAAGVSHILALSGMHLSVIYFLLSFLFVGRRFAVLRESLLVAAVWGYVFMVGMSPSVVRSALMITVYSAVGLTGRDRMSLNVLAFAALLMLVANPFSLYDVGFQLSFLSVAAILVLHRPLGGLVSLRFQQRHRLFRWFWNLVVMSCSAQLATAPLVAYYFGTVPLYFLLSNLVAIPAVTVILYLSALMLALFFLPAAQQSVVMLLVFVVERLNAFLLWVASLPGAAVTDIHINTVQLLAAYMGLVAMYLLGRLLIKMCFPLNKGTVFP